MIPLLGCACVAWTAFELFRLARSETRPAFATSGADPISTEAPSRPHAAGRRRFAAWDDRGRPIEVEDLGHA